MKQIIKKLISSVLVVSLLAGIMIVSTAAPATPVDAGNLIKASNFYAGNDAWSIIHNGASVSYVEDTVPTCGKTRVLKIVQSATDSAGVAARIRQTIQLTEKTTYKVSFWLKIDGTGQDFVACYQTLADTNISIPFATNITSTNGEWVKIERTFNVDTPTSSNGFFEFEIADLVDASQDVVFFITDVHLEVTTRNYALNSTLWTPGGNGHSSTPINQGVNVVAKSNEDLTVDWQKSSGPAPSFANETEAGKTYLVAFDITIDYSNTSGITVASGRGIGEGYSVAFRNINGTYYCNNLVEYDSSQTSYTEHIEFDYTSPSGDNRTFYFEFAKALNTGETITYNITNLSITEKTSETEGIDEIKELVSVQPDAVTTDSKSASGNVFLNGDFRVKEGTTGTNFAMSSFENTGLSWPNPNAATNMKWEVVSEESRDSIFKVSGIDNPTTSGFWLKQTLTWSSGKTYVGSFWKKQEGTPKAFYLYAPGNNKVITCEKVGDAEATEWSEYRFEFTPDDSTAAYIYIMYQLTDATQVIYLDDFVIEEKLPDVGEVFVAHTNEVGGTYTISFDLDITGEGTAYTNWGDEGLFSETSRGVLYQTGFAGDAILATFDATAEGETFSYTYTPSEVDATAETSAFSLYLAPTTGGELTYTISDFSITYRDETVIKEIVVNDADITSANPGAVTDTWGTNANELAYTMIQRWERVNKGTFATTDDDINTAMTLGNFTEFESGADYRYSLVVTPNEGYYFSEDISLKLGETDVEAAYYYCADGSLIIYPTDSEVFFTYMGDANKDGSADVRDLVRMKKKLANPSDTTIEVYLKKCKFETTSPDSLIDADIAGLRTLLVNP